MELKPASYRRPKWGSLSYKLRDLKSTRDLSTPLRSARDKGDADQPFRFPYPDRSGGISLDSNYILFTIDIKIFTKKLNKKFVIYNNPSILKDS